MARTNRRLPTFTDYINREIHNSPASKRLAAKAAGVSMSLFAGAVTGSLVMVFGQGFGWAFLVGLGVFGAGQVLVSQIHRRKLLRRTANDARIEEAYEAMGRYVKLAQNRRLHKDLDPAIGQILEACAIHHERAHTALTSSFWNNPNLEGHWAALRSQCLQALDEAMCEALVLGQTCIGKAPDKARSNKVAEIIEDFADLDIIDALDGLKVLTGKGKIDPFAYQSPNSRVVFGPIRDIAERLQKLADEVERHSQRAIRGSRLSNVGAGSASIDLILGEMKSIESAEQELSQS